MTKKLSSNQFKLSVAPQSGADATTYWLIPSETQVKRKADGTHFPEYVSCECRSKTGEGNPVSGIGTIKFVLTYKAGSHSAEFLYASRIIITSDMTAISFRLYVGGIKVDEKTVAIIEDGHQGLPGPAGVRGRMPFPSGIWSSTTSYTSTDDIAPIAYYADGKTYYVMNKSTTVIGVNPAMDYAENGNNATWIPFQNYEAIFVKILMANFGKLASAVFHGDYMFSQYGRDASGKVSSDYSKFNPANVGKPGCEFAPNLMLDMMSGKYVGLDTELKGGKIGGFSINGSHLENRDGSDCFMTIDHTSGDSRHFSAFGNHLPGATGRSCAGTYSASGPYENIALMVSATGSTSPKWGGGMNNIALKGSGGCDWVKRGDDYWRMPGLLGVIRFLCSFSDNTYHRNAIRIWGNGIPSVSVRSLNVQERIVSIGMDMGNSFYSVTGQTVGASPVNGRYDLSLCIEGLDSTGFSFSTWSQGEKVIPRQVDFFIFGDPEPSDG